MDRLGWADGIAFVAEGLRVGIRVTDASVLDAVVASLPPNRRKARSLVVDRLYSLKVGGAGKKGIRHYHLLYVEGVRIARTLKLDDALLALETDLKLYVATEAKDRLFLHAGVVAVAGAAMVFPGRTHAGKTTLVRALTDEGAAYYSDEYAVLDEAGRVHPYPTPLNLRESGALVGTPRSIEELGGLRGHRPVPVGLVVLTDYRAGAVWRPRALTPAKAALELMRHAVAARTRSAFAMKTLSRLARSTPVLKGVRGEAEDTVRRILRRFEREAA